MKIGFICLVTNIKKKLGITKVNWAVQEIRSASREEAAIAGQ